MRIRRNLVGAAATVAAVVAVAAAPGCGDVEINIDDPGFEVSGEWRGRLTQKGLDPFEVVATIRSRRNATRNTVHYTEIDCSGYWRYLGHTDDTYRFRETIDRGAGGTCKGVGIVTLRPVDETLAYVFRGGGIESRGTLARVD